MKVLKIGGFFLAGAIIQTVFYYAEYLGIFAGYGGLLAVASFTSVIGVVLGNKARDIAQEKMKMSPFLLTMCYVAGTLAAMVALYFILDTIADIIDLSNIERAVQILVYLFTIPSAAINAIVQIVLCVREKIKLNKEKENGTL